MTDNTKIRPIRGKTVLIISPEDWGRCWVSKHHYAAQLAAQGNQVYFIGPSERPDPTIVVPQNLKILPPPKLPPGLRRFPAALRRAAYRKIGQRLSASVGSEFDIAWSFDGSRFHDLNSLCPSAKTIFFIADLNSSLSWRIPASQAHLCLGCSHYIVTELKKFSKNAHFIQHGHADFAARSHRFTTESPNVVYSGNLSHAHLDQPRLLTLVRRHPDIHFHFFGDDGSGNLGDGAVAPLARELKELQNCRVHGSVSPTDLPGIYQAADTLLVCHKPGFERIGNPHKMMEYLASGTPILTTNLKEYESLGSAICAHDDLEAYCSNLPSLVQGDGKEEPRILFAKQHSYPQNLIRIGSLLENQAP